MRVVWGLSLFLLLSGAGGRCWAQKYLSGELSGTYPAGEYIVSGTIHILPKTTLSFEPGCIVRFENYAGIVVRGTLLALGTPLRPISFTSSRDIPDSDVKPVPFDWNGITVTAEAESISIAHCIVAYSNYGITVESSYTPVSIAKSWFHDNGSASLTIEKRTQSIPENSPVSFGRPSLEAEQSALRDPSSWHADTLPSVNKGAGASEHAPAATRPPSPGGWKKGARTAALSVAAAGGIAAIAGSALSHYYDKKYHAAASEAMPPLRKKRDMANQGWMAGTVICGLGAAGFVITLAF